MIRLFPVRKKERQTERKKIRKKNVRVVGGYRLGEEGNGREIIN